MAFERFVPRRESSWSGMLSSMEYVIVVAVGKAVPRTCCMTALTALHCLASRTVGLCSYFSLCVRKILHLFILLY